MLLSFTIKNFKSILDTTIDLSFAEGKAPNGYRDMETLPFLKAGDNRLVPVLAVYGANASGKSNIIEGFLAFQHVIKRGIVQQYQPNLLNSAYTSTVFSYTGIIDNKKYTYTIEYDAHTIIKEELYLDKLPIFIIDRHCTDFENIATSTYTSKKLHDIFVVETQNLAQYQTKTFLHTLANNYAGLNRDITLFYAKITQQTIITMQNKVVLRDVINKLALSYDSKNQAFEKISAILRKLDIDITKITFKEEVLPIKDDVDIKNALSNYNEVYAEKGVYYAQMIKSYHKNINGDEIAFDFTQESMGTQVLAGLIGLILYCLIDGKMLVVDEIDKSIHPLLLRNIVNIFKDKRYNTQNAQLIATVHNTDILDDEALRISEVAFTNKTTQKGTILTRIANFDNARNILNFRKQYLSGAFTGIPFPYI